jgi:2-polyprenyl-3-methyl-5-hydroxy-6-metoxy-1,4-benzoquinol methylase
MSREDLKTVDSHFAFGKNWASYADLIDEPQIEAAKEALLKLIPAEEFRERSMLDIGCGSGLHALAATRLGVSRLLAIDIDADSVATSIAVFTGRNITTPWKAEVMSVFDLDSARQGTYDIVYSWGVLHHTGDMWDAIGKAASMVNQDGLLAIALYRSTRMDRFWKIEKRAYAHAPQFIQRIIRAGYIVSLRAAMAAKRRSLRGLILGYKSVRGMDFNHDVHDWLGGYPYETALAPEVDRKLVGLGFKAVRVFAGPIQTGVFGSGCDEYVYRLISPR